MPEYKSNQLVMEGVTLLPGQFRNFAGREGMYNREGDRNFAIALDDDVAKKMLKDGWNIKWLKSREEGDPEQAYISVAVNFKGRPPRIVMITSNGRTNLTEDEVEFLDQVDIANCDLIIRPYHWNVNGKTGVKAYLQSIFVTIEEDYLELKYADVQEASQLTSRHQPRALEAGSYVPPEIDETDDIVDAEIVDDE